MPDARPGKPPSKPGSKPGGKPWAKGAWPGQPGEQPGDEWGDDNPGNVHAAGVDDHVFFHRDGSGPAAGRVVAHGVHGCTVEDDRGARHKVLWGRVLGLKTKAVLPSKVVDKGVGGAILEHPGGRRVFVAGELPLEDAQPRLSSLADLEQRAGSTPRPRLGDMEEFARAGSKERDLAKADHDCEGPALCSVCRARREDASPVLAKSIATGVNALSAISQRMRSRPRSVMAVPVVPMLLVRSPREG